MRKKRQRRFGFRAEVLINPDDDGRDRLVNKAAIKSGVPSSYRLGRQVEEKVL